MRPLRILAGMALVFPLLAHAEEDPAPRDFTVVLVGGSAGDGLTPTLISLQARLRELDPANAVVVFTGDYTANGLPEEGAPGRDQAERALLAHVTATQEFVAHGGKVYFLPGARDFDGPSGTKEVRRAKKFLNQSFARATGLDGLDVMPHAACATPTELELTQNLGLLLVNSQWWMQDGRFDPEHNDGCEIKTRVGFTERITDILRDHRNGRLVIASHHPLASYGEHGGAFTPAAHLSPVPLLGTAEIFARQYGLVPQYQNHPRMRAYVELMHDQAELNGAYLFASGHDGNLQYLKVDHQAQVVSGSSAQVGAPAVSASGQDFAAASAGWAELALQASGEGDVNFFLPTGAAFASRMLPPVPHPGTPIDTPAPPLPSGPVAARFSKTPTWQLPGIGEFFAGAFYARTFSLELPYDVLDLKTEQGGLSPTKVGGGKETRSLRLLDPYGGDWSVRATQKDPTRVPPYPYNRIYVAQRLLDYAFTAGEPEAALSIPPLASALGLLHPTPRLMYLPDQDALGEYRGFIGDEVVLLEQRPRVPERGELPANLGGALASTAPVKFERYEPMVEKMLADPAGHRLDQESMLRARLLDIFIGDWDRHRGQWRFAQTADPAGVKTFTPIPLDRDQAFSNYDGAVLSLARLLIPLARSLQPFNESYGRLGWLNYAARDTDAFTLNQIPHDRWMQIATEVQQALNDDVIDAAMATWRPETYALDGARIAGILKVRRDKLTQVAEEFYGQLNHTVDVTGSKSDDVFDLTFASDGALRVSVRTRDDNATPYYERVFQLAETKQVRLYALEGDDLLSVHGDPSGTIDVRFVGGEGKDLVAAAGDQPLRARAIHVYDSPDGAEIAPNIAVTDERSSLARMNQYEPRENHDPDYGYFFPSVLVTSDQLTYLGGTYTHVLQGFKKTPFASMHSLTAYLALENLGVAVDYRGLFPESLGLLDQQVDLVVHTSTFTRNFFGITNTFVEDADTPDFYTLDQARYEGRYGLVHTFDEGRGRVGGQVLAQAIVTENTPGRYVNVSGDVTPESLGNNYFVGGRLFAEYNTYDSLELPRRGVVLHGSAEGRYGLNRNNPFSTTYRALGGAAIPLERTRRVVLMARLGVEGIVGEHPFYLAPTLGGSTLRAYHYQQLAGDVAFANANDLRVDVFRIQTVLPGTIGFHLSLDNGRVFGPGISNDTWHVNYGGGLFWSVVDKFGVSAGYFRGLDGGSRFTLQIGNLFTIANLGI